MSALLDLVWIVLALVVAAAGLRLRARLRRERPTLDDEAVRSIEGRGRVEVDEPLDMEHIEAEERRFLRDADWE